MGNKTKSVKRPIPSIQITLTTFCDDENGDIGRSATGTVKIDGEDDFPKEIIFDYSILKSVHVKNLFVLSFGHFLLWMAFDTLSNLQSTINARKNMGQISLAVIYGAFAISSFFLPTIVLKRLGSKKTLVYFTIGLLPYILANFYSSWFTLIPTAIVCGLALGPLWSARSVYLNELSHRYAGLRKNSVGVMNAWFFGVYTVFKQNTEIWGNLFAYYLLKTPEENQLGTSKTVPDKCGPEFCNEDDLSSILNFVSLPDGRTYILVTLLAALALVTLFYLAFFLETLESEDGTRENEAGNFLISDLLATFHQFANWDQVLLIPLALYTGLVNGYYDSDYKKVYIACAWGFRNIAVVSVCYGVVSAMIASAGGACVQVLGRATLFFLAAIAHLSMFLAMLFWKPTAENTTGFFLIASAFGIGNGVWISQLVALYGVLFKDKEEAGFSCFYFLNSLGSLLAYSYSNYFCTNIKIYIPLSLLVIGILCYLTVEIRILKKILFEYNSKRLKQSE